MLSLCTLLFVGAGPTPISVEVTAGAPCVDSLQLAKRLELAGFMVEVRAPTSLTLEGDGDTLVVTARDVNASMTRKVPAQTTECADVERVVVSLAQAWLRSPLSLPVVPATPDVPRAPTPPAPPVAPTAAAVRAPPADQPVVVADSSEAHREVTPEARVDAVPSSNWSAARIGAVGAWAGGAVSLGLTLSFALRAQMDRLMLQDGLSIVDDQGRVVGITGAEAERLQLEMARYSTAAIALGLTSAVLTASGFALWFLAPRRPGASAVPTPGVALTPTAGAVSLTWALP